MEFMKDFVFEKTHIEFLENCLCIYIFIDLLLFYREGDI